MSTPKRPTATPNAGSSSKRQRMTEIDGPFERDVAQLKATILREAKAGKPFCEQCGVDCGTETGRQRHAKLHKAETNGEQAQDEQTNNQFVCSVCGVCLKNQTLRNRHEKDKHRVKRTGTDVRSKEAIALTIDHLEEVVNVGFGLLQVQRAVPAFDAQMTAPIVERMLNRPKAKGPHLDCAECGLRFNNHSKRSKHENAHVPILGHFRCALCGIYEATAAKRNRHEREMHLFERTGDAQKKREAVVIPPANRDRLEKIGTNIDELTRAAAVGEGNEQRGEQRDEDDEDFGSVATWSDESEMAVGQEEGVEQDETENVRPVPPRGQRRAERQAPAEVIATNNRSSKRAPATPAQEQPTAAQSLDDAMAASFRRPSTQTTEGTTEEIAEGKAALLEEEEVSILSDELDRLMGCSPTVVFYDYRELKSTYSRRPMDAWLQRPDCRLLVLRLPPTTRWWRLQPSELAALQCASGRLADGSVLFCYAKTAAEQLGERLTAATIERRPFGSLMRLLRGFVDPPDDEDVEEPAEELSALIVCSDEDRKSILRHHSRSFMVL